MKTSVGSLSALICGEKRKIQPNGYPTTCLDLAQYVVGVMYVRAHSDNLPGFYMQIALTF